MRREGEPAPYSGKYLFQFMTEEESRMYVEILSKNYPRLFPRAEMERKAAERLILED